jgi:hypothetical protein
MLPRKFFPSPREREGKGTAGKGWPGGFQAAESSALMQI